MKVVPILLCVNIFLGCTNKYEKKMVGIYKTLTSKSIRIEDSSKFIVDSILLSLGANNTFYCEIFGVKKRSIVGRWQSGDDGDRTWIKFFYDSVFISGSVGGQHYNEITIYNANHWGLDKFKNIVLVKTSQARLLKDE